MEILVLLVALLNAGVCVGAITMLCKSFHLGRGR
jgi:hypothetical protein